MGVRLLMIKQDGTFMVFSDGGGGANVKPQNWMTAPTAIDVDGDPPTRIEVRIGTPVSFEALKAERGKTPTSDLYRKAATHLRSKLEALSNLPLK